MTTNRDWLFSLPLEEQYAWMNAEHQEPNPDCSAMLYKTFTGNMCSHYEPKDGVVAILREAARNLSDYHDAGEALRRLTDTGNVYHALETLADMVERDYVRRESIEEVMDNDRALVDENSMLARELLKLRAELEKATNNLNSANKDFENARAELAAERDYWKEQTLSCLIVDELFDERDELKGQVFTLKSECDDLENELYKLTAELDAAKQQISRFDAPKSVETPENPASKCEISDFDDSRDKLEADVRKHYAYSTTTLMYPPSANKTTDMLRALPVDTVIGWLDRQAAITKRETLHDNPTCSGRSTYASKDEIRDVDIWNVAYEIYCAGGYVDNGNEPNPPTDGIRELLDRQAAITRREVLCQPDERDEQIAELTAKVKRWANAANGQRLVAMAQADKVQELTSERDKAREESVELYSDLVKASDEREHYREKCSKMATIIHDALMVMDEGMA